MNEHNDLNGTPEQQISLKEGQEYLSGTGMTVTMGGIASHYINDENALKLKDNNFETDTISFCLQNEVVMKISKEGFFWKGKLVAEDKEIYQKFKEFFNKVI